MKNLDNFYFSPNNLSNLEASVQKGLELLGQAVVRLYARLALLGDEPEGPEGGLLQVGGLAVLHLDGHDPQGPNVHLFA